MEWKEAHSSLPFKILKAHHLPPLYMNISKSPIFYVDLSTFFAKKSMQRRAEKQEKKREEQKRKENNRSYRYFAVG